MPSKRSERQQHNNHALAKVTGKILPRFNQEEAGDPWSFLEAVDAPQWVDLSLEARSSGQEGMDPWFGEIHEHHAISLAGLNSTRSWVHSGKSCLDKPVSHSASSQGKGRGYGMIVTKLEKRQNTRNLKVSGHGYLSKVKDSQSEKKASYTISSNRGSKAYLSSSRLHGSVDSLCTSSGGSSNCDYEPGSSLQERSSLCNDMPSVTSSMQSCELEGKSLVNAQRGSLKQLNFRGSKAHVSSTMLQVSVDSVCTSSGGSSNSENGSARSVKERNSLCSDISSVTSSLQACALEPKSLVNVRRGSVKQLRVGGCASECERDLAALVAQHNQKIQILKLQGCRKELR